MTILTPFTLAVLSWAFIFPVNVQDNTTTCQGTGLSWYTDVVGETPYQSIFPGASPTLSPSQSISGQTYQRLHQICDPDCMFNAVHATLIEKLTLALSR